MIGYVRGVVTHLFKDACYVDVHGVGYRVYVPTTTRQLLVEGEESTLFTYLNVREDAMQLYGFSTEDEYELFILLISVSGIGPKVGLGILSGMTPEAFKLAILNGQVAQLTKLPGIGKKSAERLVLELKDKLAKMTTISVNTVAAVQPIGITVGGPAGEAIDGLVALGYAQNEVETIVERLDDGTRDVPALIKAALAEIGKGR
ncbi:MAG: Holliday junction branch migration protein RuvA [Veillonella sp.]|uniref:Holliday junction branch migration protein RuvA n=1 Tax=Veillonella sp. TaxID=1926307 RepID=UPI001B66B7ED|nr:Holliday junction branch migration protein RuvA [Veillonella sp.]MBK7921717.1 Holliday junction branch migration protein RuvA [Veillonella sp.]MBP8617397.1 Holliday junction branch migration protein RuvA [Veillonella sp.]MBP9517461.1 Holliday junction branch migration protein RuvA [Veillonella sp.]